MLLSRTRSSPTHLFFGGSKRGPRSIMNRQSTHARTPRTSFSVGHASRVRQTQRPRRVLFLVSERLACIPFFRHRFLFCFFLFRNKSARNGRVRPPRLRSGCAREFFFPNPPGLGALAMGRSDFRRLTNGRLGTPRRHRTLEKDPKNAAKHNPSQETRNVKKRKKKKHTRKNARGQKDRKAKKHLSAAFSFWIVV